MKTEREIQELVTAAEKIKAEYLALLGAGILPEDAEYRAVSAHGTERMKEALKMRMANQKKTADEKILKNAIHAMRMAGFSEDKILQCLRFYDSDR